MSGYIKLYRDIQLSELWEDKPFNKATAWIDLLLIAKFQDEKVLIGNQMMIVKRGEIITSTEDLQKRWGWGNTRVRNFLRLLQSESMINLNIKRSVSRQQTAIEIVNYSKYQGGQTDKKDKPSVDDGKPHLVHNPTQNQTAVELDSKGENEHRQTSNKPPANRQQTDDRVNIYKELKEYKEYKEEGECEGGTTESRIKFGTRISMKQSEYDALCKRFSQSTVDDKIETMDNWLIAKGKTFKDYYRALINWIKEDIQKEKNSPRVKRLMPSTFEPSDELKEVPWT